MSKNVSGNPRERIADDELAALADSTARKLAEHRLVRTTTGERYAEVVADFSAAILEALKMPRASELEACWRQIAARKLDRTPPGTQWLTGAYLCRGQIIINGEPPACDADDAAGHHCDAMGCSSVQHVVARLPHHAERAGNPHGVTLDDLVEATLPAGTMKMPGDHGGWDCPASPNGKCHYESEPLPGGKRGIRIDNGTPYTLPDSHDYASESLDHCIFCGEPEERK